MTNLSNERKETLLKDIMRFLGYTEETTVAVVKSIAVNYNSIYTQFGTTSSVVS
jgi:hypothetical protein